ncbi:MAG: barstar family protein [Alphaproteobacteria bacterium]|nr:barstar family protein [Alphaproteobacteria bacterium]
MSIERRVVLDFARLATVDQLHDALARDLALPAHYGRNLDALWDCLTTDVKGPVEIVLRHADKAAPNIQPYLALLREAAAKRRGLRIRKR